MLLLSTKLLHQSEYRTSSTLGTREGRVVRSPASWMVPASRCVEDGSCITSDFRNKCVVVGEELVVPGFQHLSAHMDLLILNKGLPMLCPCPLPPAQPQELFVQATRPLLLLHLTNSLGLWPPALPSQWQAGCRKCGCNGRSMC